MTVTKAYIVTLYPEFAAADETRVNTLVEIVEDDFDSAVWGNKLDRGIAALVAHMMKVGDQGATGAAGPVTSESIGDLSRTYGNIGVGSDSDNPFRATSYGQDYLRLRRTLIAGPRVT